jgi:hypothetical protein
MPPTHPCMQEATMTRRTIALLIAFALGLVVAPFAADAPPPKKAPTIGMLEPGFPPSAPD